MLKSLTLATKIYGIDIEIPDTDVKIHDLDIKVCDIDAKNRNTVPKSLTLTLKIHRCQNP